MNSVLRIVCLFLLGVFAVIAGFAPLAHPSRAEQDVQVIEVTAEKYAYTPWPFRVRPGAQVHLKITSLDKTLGFKINLYPDGSGGKVIRASSSARRKTASRSRRKLLA